jgi:hypothetical protein
MAEKEYTVVAPDGKEITLIGPVGASQADVIAQAQKLYQPNNLPKFTPTAENRGNIINSDVPTVVGSQANAVNAQPQAKPVSMMDRVKALYEVPTAIAYGAVKEPLSMAYGLGRSAVEGAMQGQAPTGEARDKYYRQAKEFAPYQPTSPATPQALEAIGGALEAAKIPPYLGAIGAIPSAIQKAPNIKPVMQESVMPAANKMAGALRNEGEMIAQAAQPVTSRITQAVEPVANKIASALRKTPTLEETAPTSAFLAEESSKYFNKAKASGVELNPEYFSNMMKSVGSDLRNLGYDADLMPKVAVALKHLQNDEIPKDFHELSVLRKFIRNAQRSRGEPEERMVATHLKAEFDDYIANMPDSSVIGGNKQGLADWKKARDSYAKLSKSEVFEDMLDKAEIRDSKLSTEQYLHNKLLELSESENRMRLFTPQEQEAIRKAAKGTGLQNALARAGKYSLRNISATTLGSILGLGLAGPVGAVVAPTIGGIAKYKATKIRKNDVNNLAAMVRAGKTGVENE